MTVQRNARQLARTSPCTACIFTDRDAGKLILSQTDRWAFTHVTTLANRIVRRTDERFTLSVDLSITPGHCSSPRGNHL